MDVGRADLALTISPVSVLYSGTLPVDNPIAMTSALPPSCPSGGNANAVAGALNSIVCRSSRVSRSNRYTFEASVPIAAYVPEDETAAQVGLPASAGSGSFARDWLPSAESSWASSVVARSKASLVGAPDTSVRGCAPVETAEELRGSTPGQLRER